MSLANGIKYIQTFVDSSFQLIVQPQWGSANPNHRQEIRSYLSTSSFSSHFNRQQLAQLPDLNSRPEASNGFFSISHCQNWGGFSYSQERHGLDIESKKRISNQIVRRTSTDKELTYAHQPELLWVAKESAFKALSHQTKNLVLPDLECIDWDSHNENTLWTFRINLQKTLDLSRNLGFIFSDEEHLFSIYYQ